MKRIFFALLACTVFSGCAVRLGPPPALTNTERGEAIMTIEPQRTGDRKDIPQGSKPKHVIKIETKTGAKYYVDTKKGTVSANEQGQEELKAAEIPKRSWALLWWILGILALLFAIDWILRRFLGFNPIRWIIDIVKQLFSIVRNVLKKR